MKGIYVLLIFINKDIKIKIGKLGKINFNKGHYFYVGSAQNNLEKRIKRHELKRKKKHWHIDYLLSYKNVKIKDIFYKIAGKKWECKTAFLLSKFCDPVLCFGSSDCKCKGHLLKVNKVSIQKKLKTFIKYHN